VAGGTGVWQVIGQTYLERGEPVTVLARWAAARPAPGRPAQDGPAPDSAAPGNAAPGNAAPGNTAPGNAARGLGIIWLIPPRPTAPRNVLIRRADGTLTVRPFRGLRRPPPSRR